METRLEKFEVTAPFYSGQKCCQSLTAYNVIAEKRGTQNCVVGIASHDDTKYFENFRFIGANDGGSSTILLMNIAKKIAKKHTECDVDFIFFDGEEALLKNWDDGINLFSVTDNTYGSRYFASHDIRNSKINEKKIKLFLFFDMIGHKNLKLSLTKGSNIQESRRWMKLNSDMNFNIGAQLTSNFIEDDHKPFLDKNIPLIHFIDWFHLKEWHTSSDDIPIIDFQSIEKLSQVTEEFILTLS